jgi:hypothetical protein
MLSPYLGRSDAGTRRKLDGSLPSCRTFSSVTIIRRSTKNQSVENFSHKRQNLPLITDSHIESTTSFGPCRHGDPSDVKELLKNTFVREAEEAFSRGAIFFSA